MEPWWVEPRWVEPWRACLVVLPRVHEDALGRLGLLQLGVDRDERLYGRRRVRVRLDLAVVQRLGVVSTQ